MITAALALLAVALLLWPPQSAAALRLSDLVAHGRLPAGPAPVEAAVGAQNGRGPGSAFRSARPGHRRQAAQEADVLRAVRLVAQELRDGADPARAWAGAVAVANGGPGWIAAVARQAAAGEPIGVALANAAAQVGLARADGAAIARLGAAWSCGAGSGASAAEVLEQWAGDSAARQRAAAELQSQLAGPRASALLLAGLPVLGAVMGTAMGAEPLGTLFGSGAGLSMLACGLTLEVVGVLWVRRIVVAAERA